MNIPTDLGALKAEMNKPKVAEKSQDELEEVKANLRSNEFTPEDIKTAWQGFIDKSDLQVLDLEVLNQPYELAGTQVTVAIPNEALVSGFEKIRGELLKHLRTALKNDHISLQSVVVELNQEKMLYTDREKFEFLKKKYPALKDLQEKLGLDPEF